MKELDRPFEPLRKQATDIFQVGINAANPYQAVTNCLKLNNHSIDIALEANDFSKVRREHWSKVHIIAFGKAACSMAKAATQIIPEQLLASKPIAVTNYQNQQSIENIEVFAANHPIPDISGQQAAQHIVERLKSTQPNELVLVLVSGGGSALIPYPADGITLEDKQLTTDLLLASGADIEQINCVRKHLSQIKGGQLAQLASPADVHALILSDVIGDKLDAIASGPTIPDESTYAEAISILKDVAIWDKIPLSVQALLNKGVSGNISETPNKNNPCFQRTSQTLIGSNSISVKALLIEAQRLGYNSEIYSHVLIGEAKEVAEQLVLHAKTRIGKGLKQAIAIIAGGETTVTLSGTGRGGRNQEMALAFAIAAERHQLKGNWVFLSGGTDGLDGPTDAAGGLVDPDTLTRIKMANAVPEKKLNNNDSYSALKKSQDLVITGATGTNVADLQILLFQPE